MLWSVCTPKEKKVFALIFVVLKMMPSGVGERGRHKGVPTHASSIVYDLLLDLVAGRGKEVILLLMHSDPWLFFTSSITSASWLPNYACI